MKRPVHHAAHKSRGRFRQQSDRHASYAEPKPHNLTAKELRAKLIEVFQKKGILDSMKVWNNTDNK